MKHLSTALLIALASLPAWPQDVDFKKVYKNFAKNNIDVYWDAYRTLKESKDPAAADMLILALKKGRHEILAVEALGDKKDERAVDPLIEYARDLGDEKDACKVADALGKIQSPKAVEFLVSLLSSKHDEVRSKAAWALGEIGDPRAVEPLLGLRKDDSYDPREAAAKALVRIKDPSILQRVLALLNEDPNDYFARQAGEALSGLGAGGVEELLQAFQKCPRGDSKVRSLLVNALAEIGDARAADAFIAVLKEYHDPKSSLSMEDRKTLLRADSSARIRSCWGLEKIKDPRAVDVLLMVAGSSEEASGTREAAADALAAIGDSKVRDYFKSLLGKDDARSIVLRECDYYIRQGFEGSESALCGLLMWGPRGDEELALKLFYSGNAALRDCSEVWAQGGLKDLAEKDKSDNEGRVKAKILISANSKDAYTRSMAEGKAEFLGFSLRSGTSGTPAESPRWGAGK